MTPALFIRRLALPVTAAFLVILTSVAIARDPAEVNRLAALLTDDNPLVRKRAAIALGELGEEARSAVPALEKALTDTDPGVRVAVAEALDKVSGGGGVGSAKLEDLVRLVTDGKADAGKRKAAIKQLVEAHYKEDAAVKAISQALLDPVLKNDAAAALDEIDRKLGGTKIIPPPPGPLKDLVMQGHMDDVFGVVFTPDGKHVASSDRAGDVILWDSYSGKQVKKFNSGGDALYHLAVSPDGKRLAAPGDMAAYVWDVSGGPKAALTVKDVGNYAVSFSPDGGRVVSGGTDNLLHIWDARTGKVISTLKGHTNIIYDCMYSPDGKMIVSGSEDGTARVWDAITGKEIYAYHGHKEKVYGVSFSPDSKRCASGGIGDNTVQIWDARTGNNPIVCKGHTDGVRGVMFSPDGRYVASAGKEGDIILWDAATGRKLHTFKGHTNFVNRVAWSPDGRRIASSSWDHDVRVWVVPKL